MKSSITLLIAFGGFSLDWTRRDNLRLFASPLVWLSCVSDNLRRFDVNINKEVVGVGVGGSKQTVPELVACFKRRENED
jgi:hypothetical protein